MKLKMLKQTWLKQRSSAKDSQREGSFAPLAKFTRARAMIFHKKLAKETEIYGGDIAITNLDRHSEDAFHQDAGVIPVQDEQRCGVLDECVDASHSPALGKSYWEHLVESIVDTKEDAKHTKVAEMIEVASSTAHNRQLSASSTLPVSLRSHASEPLLRCKARVEHSVTGKVNLSENFTSQLKELKEFTNEKTWNFILASREIEHNNEISDLKEEHEDVVKELREALVTAENQIKSSNERDLYLQKQMEREASAKLGALNLCEVLKKKLAQGEANSIANGSSLLDENARLLSIQSDLEARETSYQNAIVAATASNAKLLQEVESMKRVLTQAKREFDHSKFKLWELQSALDGKPILDKVDQQVTIDYQVNQIKQLTTNTILLSTELEEMEVKLARREAETHTELEDMAKKLVRTNCAKEVLEKKLNNVHEAYEALLSQPRNWFRHSKNEQSQAMRGCFEALREEGEVLRSAIMSCQIKEAVAEEDRSIWECRYHSLRDEMSMKQKKFTELEEAFRMKDCSLGTLTIELEAVTREKTAEIDYSKRKISVLENKVAELSQHIDSLGRKEDSAQMEWCLDFKAAQNSQLQHSLQQANEHVKNLEIYVQETEYTERLDTELGQVTDCVINDLGYSLYQTEAECAQLRMENTALYAELQAVGGTGLRNAFLVEQKVQEDANDSVGCLLNDSFREVLLNHRSTATALEGTLRGVPISTASEARVLSAEADRRMASAEDDIPEPTSFSTQNISASRLTSEVFELRKRSGEMITAKVAGNLRRVPGGLALFAKNVTTNRKGKEEIRGGHETMSNDEEFYGHLEGCYEEYFEDIEEVDENLSLAQRSLLHDTPTRSMMYDRLPEDYEHPMHVMEGQMVDAEFLVPQGGCSSACTQTQCASPSGETVNISK